MTNPVPMTERSNPPSHRRRHAQALSFLIVAAVAASGSVVAATPGSAAAPAALSQTKFGGGYSAMTEPFTGSRTTLTIPRATTCDIADGSVTVNAYETGDGTFGASFTSRCKDGVASYSGTFFYGEGQPIESALSGGDRITVSVKTTATLTSVAISSSAGWGQGVESGEGHQLTSYTAFTSGKLGAGSEAGGLRTQKFSRIKVGGVRLGDLHALGSFGDGCTDVTDLRHQWTFNTIYTC